MGSGRGGRGRKGWDAYGGDGAGGWCWEGLEWVRRRRGRLWVGSGMQGRPLWARWRASSSKALVWRLWKRVLVVVVAAVVLDDGQAVPLDNGTWQQWQRRRPSGGQGKTRTRRRRHSWMYHLQLGCRSGAGQRTAVGWGPGTAAGRAVVGMQRAKVFPTPRPHSLLLQEQLQQLLLRVGPHLLLVRLWEPQAMAQPELPAALELAPQSVRGCRRGRPRRKQQERPGVATWSLQQLQHKGMAAEQHDKGLFPLVGRPLPLELLRRRRRRRVLRLVLRAEQQWLCHLILPKRRTPGQPAAAQLRGRRELLRHPPGLLCRRQGHQCLQVESAPAAAAAAVMP